MNFRLQVKSATMVLGAVLFLIGSVMAADDAIKTEAAAGKTSEAKVAMVNGVPILRADFDGEYNLYMNNMRQRGQGVSPEQFDTVQQTVLDNLIGQELLFQESVKQGIKVNNDEITTEIDKIKQRFPNDAEFKQAMLSMNISEAVLTSKINKGISIKKLVEKDVEPKVTVSDSETKGFYDDNPNSFSEPQQVKASHILVKVDAMADDAQKKAAKEKIEKVQAKIKKGEDFAALAKEYSDCPSGAQGGDLGFFGPGAMVKPFEDAAFAMNTGEISDIVITQFGYHLIKVVEKKDAREVSYQEAKGDITNYLKRRKTDEEIKALITSLREAAKIEQLM